MAAQSTLLLFIEGLTDIEETKQLRLEDGTVNFYPIDAGYLQNYPGRTDYYDRNKPDPGVTDSYGTPPSLSSGYTRCKSFVDSLGIDHLVFVKGDKVYEVTSNGSTEIATLNGDNVSGNYYPSMFVHESKLIILNSGNVPLIWDGIDGVTPLGVHEVPSSPVNVSTMNPYTTGLGFDTYSKGDRWYHWREGVIQTGPSLRTDSGGTKIEGWYRTIVQFVDKYGNAGKASSPSPMFSVQPVGSNSWDRRTFNCTWEPPNQDVHIHWVKQGRTLQLNPSDESSASSTSTFYQELYQEGVTRHYHTQRYTDTSLALNFVIDRDVGPPPSATIGTSFGGRIWVVDSNGLIWYSDLVLFGQFRATQTFRPLSKCVALVPAGDRLFVIGETSTEVLYESANGPALLEQDDANGSSYGTSFVAAGDGAIFGLWNEGFGIYDGRNHVYVNTPEYLKDYYLSAISFKANAVKVNDWYYLPIKKGQNSTGNNVIVMYSFKRTSWYVVEETVNDVCYWNEEIIGVDNSVYILYRGDTFPAAKVKTAGLVFGQFNQEKVLSDVRLLMEPSSFTDVSIAVLGEQISSKETGSGTAYPLKSINLSSKNPEDYWDKPNTNYGTKWISPGDVYLQMRHTKPVVGFYHKINVDFSAGHLVRIKGLGFVISTGSIPEQR